MANGETARRQLDQETLITSTRQTTGNMQRLGRLTVGVMIATCVIHLLLGLWLVTPRRKTSTDKERISVIGWQRTASVTRPTLKVKHNASATQSIPYLKPNLTQPALNLTTNATRSTITGAVHHYKSLLDDRLITLRCSSCALVSSSGFLLGKGAGREIDRHACVIRMNQAPVEGYEADVGNRTTLRVMNFFTGVHTEKMPPGSRLMVWGLFQHNSSLNKVIGVLKRLSANTTIYGQTVKGEKEAGDLFTKETGQPRSQSKTWLSTGWFTMMIALDICEELHVYGMVSSDYCASKPKTDFPYHYYQKTSVKECSTYNAAETSRRGAHRFITEKAVFARWALRYNITFHYPDWTLDSEKLEGKLDTPFVNKQINANQKKTKPQISNKKQKSAKVTTRHIDTSLKKKKKT